MFVYLTHVLCLTFISLNTFKNVEICKFLEFAYAFIISFDDFFIVEEYPADVGLDVCNVMSRMNGRAFVRDERLYAVLRWEFRGPARIFRDRWRTGWRNVFSRIIWMTEQPFNRTLCISILFKPKSDRSLVFRV